MIIKLTNELSTIRKKEIRKLKYIMLKKKQSKWNAYKKIKVIK